MKKKAIYTYNHNLRVNNKFSYILSDFIIKNCKPSTKTTGIFVNLKKKNKIIVTVVFTLITKKTK